MPITLSVYMIYNAAAKVIMLINYIPTYTYGKGTRNGKAYNIILLSMNSMRITEQDMP